MKDRMNQRFLPRLEALEDRLVPSASPTYIVDDGGDLFTVNVTTGATQFIAKASTVMYDLALSPTGQLYGVGKDGNLYTINTTSAATTLIGSLVDHATGARIPYPANALDFRWDGTLYVAALSNVYQVNPQTAEATLLFTLPNNELSTGDLVFDPEGDMFVTTFDGSLVKASPSLNSSANVGQRGILGFDDFYGLVWSNGTLFGFSDSRRAIYQINPDTGRPQFQATLSSSNNRIPQGVNGATQLPATPLAMISGSVFQDVNGNGVQDPPEPGIAGQTLYLDLDGSGTFKAGDPAAVTDRNGNFQFAIGSAGTYTVRQVLLGGVLLRTPSSGSYQVTVTSGTNATNENFGDVPTSIAVPLTLPPSTPFVKEGNANADYVEALYRSILDRDAEPGGLAYWTGLLNGGVARLTVVQGIRNSPEHFTQEVTRFYDTILGRSPDPTGLQVWVQALANGSLTEEQVAFAFFNSGEYLGKGDKYFVDQMYLALLGRPFDAPGEADWLNALGDDAFGNPTQPPSLTHEQVITDFLYSEESLTRLVQGYYQVFLQRLADPTGLSAWVAALQNRASFLSIGQEFLSSGEFYNRAAAQG